MCIRDRYEESLAQNPNPYEMKDEIFCNVLRCRYLSGELEKERYILEYKAYCDYVFAHDEMDRDGAFYDSRLFQVGLYHVSGLVMLLADRNLKLPDREAPVSYTHLSSMEVAMKVANRVEAGACIIGGSGNYRLAHQPFGGYKYSGIGREGAVITLEEMTRQKTISFKGILN